MNCSNCVNGLNRLDQFAGGIALSSKYGAETNRFSIYSRAILAHLSVSAFWSRISRSKEIEL